jgi:hypothetical protein
MQAGGTMPLRICFAAFQQQLGLKLESTQAPVDVMVIDKVERPSENYLQQSSYIARLTACARRTFDGLATASVIIERPSW